MLATLNPFRRPVGGRRVDGAAGIEPGIDFNATGQLPCGCVICEECRAAPALHFWRTECPLASPDGVVCQDGECPPAGSHVARAWSDLPPHIREAIVALVDAGMPLTDSRPTSNSSGDDKRAADLAWRLARQCREVVQSCLREEEWSDADQTFFAIISGELSRGRIDS
jgi:hypothetical protein